MKHKPEIEKILKNTNRKVLDLMDKDLLDYGICAWKVSDVKIEYVDPIDPNNEHLFNSNRYISGIDPYTDSETSKGSLGEKLNK
jgi:hypothetical protein